MTEPVKFVLKGDDSKREAKVKVYMPESGSALFIEVEGMENEHGNPLLALDLQEGMLALFAWTDHSEEYTHRLDLDAGKITEAHEDRDVPKVGVCPYCGDIGWFASTCHNSSFYPEGSVAILRCGDCEAIKSDVAARKLAKAAGYVLDKKGVVLEYPE